MSDLPRNIRSRLDAARGAGPTFTDRARIRAKLDARLLAVAGAGAVTAAAVTAAATTAGTTASAASTTATAAANAAATSGAASLATPAGAAAQQAIAVSAKFGWFGFLPKIGLSIVLLGATGLAARSLVHHTSASAPAATAALVSTDPNDHPNAVVTADPVAIASAVAAPDPSAADSSTADLTVTDAVGSADPLAKPTASAPKAMGSNRAPSIAAEVLLLRRAQTALKDGNGDASLRAIDALEAMHPNGALREERSAARVLALCAAGRTDDARAEANRFLAEWPSSAQGARVRSSCVFASPTKP